MNRAASELGKLAAGVPKKFSTAELVKRTVRLNAARRENLKRAALNSTGNKIASNLYSCGIIPGRDIERVAKQIDDAFAAKGPR